MKFFTFLSPSRMGLTKPRPGSGTILCTIDFSKAFDSVWHPALFNKLILAGLPGLALFVGLNFSFLIGALARFIKITTVFPFESVKVFRKDPFLALYFSLFINDFPVFLSSSVSCSLYADDLTVWSSSPRSPQRWRPHLELCFDWSAGLSTGVFLSIRANARPASSQSIPTKLASSPTSSYSALTSVSTPLQLFLGLPSTALFPVLNMCPR